jgi:murein DD-endopeptidase MepM/ murein hydrolase activator NlpD
MRPLLGLFLLAIPALSLTIERLLLGAEADESTCTLAGISEQFEATHDQVYVRFIARGIRSGDRLRVDWIDPRGQVHTSSDYESLPLSGSLCFVNALPVGGFPAGQQPGTWTVRVAVNRQVKVQRSFLIRGSVDPAAPRVLRVNRQDAGNRQTDIEVLGSGFLSDSVVNLAQYTRSGGWSYIAMVIPEGATPERLALRIAALEPAEYLVIVRNPDGRQSAPARFLVSTPGGYKLPTPAGIPWVITQRPYGGFSHYGRSRHAWDIAPGTRACLVAMRGGTAYTFDRGWKQTPNRRIFGNYITVAHDDGEFSHYAHLETGTFRVRNGDRVEQGQPLATAGNSGYTVGQGGGRHVHVHVTKAFPIASPSIPFQFDDLPDSPQRDSRQQVVSSNNVPKADCSRAQEGQFFTASLAVTEVWTHVLPVAPGSAALALGLDYQGEGLDLSVVSPDGRHYALYADPTGFSAAGRQFRIPNPLPGQWLICVRGMTGNGERTSFRVAAEATAPAIPAALH